MKNLSTRIKLAAATVGTLAMLSLGCSAAIAQDATDDGLAAHLDRIEGAKQCGFALHDYPISGLRLSYDLLINDSDPTDPQFNEWIVVKSVDYDREVWVGIYEHDQDGSIDHIRDDIGQVEIYFDGNNIESINKYGDSYLVVTDETALEMLDSANALYNDLIQNPEFILLFMEQCDATYQNPLAGMGQ